MPLGGLVTAGIGAGTSLIGGLFGKNAAKKAGDIQSQNATKVAGMATDAAAKAGAGVESAAGTGAGLVTDASGKAISTVNQGTSDANSILGSIYGGEAANLSPYLGVGYQGTQGLSDAMQPGGSLAGTFAFDPTKVADNPDYQFANQQGQQAILRAAAAQGKTISGDTLKSLTQFGAGNAAQYMQQYYNQAANTYQLNRSNTLQTLMSAIGVGQTGTNQLQSAAQNFGNQAAGNTLQAGYYGGNTMNQTAQYLSGLGVDAAKYSGTAGLQGAQIAGQALTGGAQAQSAGVVGGANAVNGALGGVANAASFYNLSKMLNPYSGTKSIGAGNPAITSSTPWFAGAGSGPVSSIADPGSDYGGG